MDTSCAVGIGGNGYLYDQIRNSAISTSRKMGFTLW